MDENDYKAIKDRVVRAYKTRIDVDSEKELEELLPKPKHLTQTTFLYELKELNCNEAVKIS